MCVWVCVVYTYIRSFILIIRPLTFQMIRIGLAKNRAVWNCCSKPWVSPPRIHELKVIIWARMLKISLYYCHIATLSRHTEKRKEINKRAFLKGYTKFVLLFVICYCESIIRIFTGLYDVITHHIGHKNDSINESIFIWLNGPIIAMQHKNDEGASTHIIQFDRSPPVYCLS